MTHIPQRKVFVLFGSVKMINLLLSLPEITLDVVVIWASLMARW